jgi:hypothetical protein
MSETGELKPVQKTLTVSIKRPFGKAEIMFGMAVNVTVSSMGEQHVEFEKICAQLEWEIADFIAKKATAQDSAISKDYKQPNAQIESQQAIRAEWGMWKGKKIIKLFTPRFIKHGLTVYDDQFKYLDVEEWMKHDPVTELEGYTAHVDMSGKTPRLVKLTKD